MYFNETWRICLTVLSCYHEKIFKDLFEYFWRFCNPKFEKWKNAKRWPCSHVEAGKTCGFIPGIPCQT